MPHAFFLLASTLIALVTAGVGPAPVHPDSLSRTRVVVQGPVARVTMRFQTLSVVEVMPRLDVDRDDELSAAEIEAGVDAIGAYVLERWSLLTGPESKTPVAGRIEAMRLIGRERESAFALQWMEAVLVFEASADLGTFALESRLFLDDNPFHRDFVSIFRGDEAEVRQLFRVGEERYVFEPASVRRPGVFTFFTRLGFDHILEGTDHLAFLLMLLVAAPRLRSLAGVVTAFTVAHSLTLAFASLDPGGLVGSIPSRFVELAIALSIAYVACENLLRKEARSAWVEAFAFGLLHGLGFAGFLGGALEGESLVVTALFGFNIGVEVGQLLVVCAIAGVFVIGRRVRKGDDSGRGDSRSVSPSLVPKWMRMGSSGIVALVAFYWFLQRAGWI